MKEAIVGDIRSLGEPAEIPQVVRRKDGSWLVDGDTPIEKVREILSLNSFPEEEDGYYYTISGLILFVLQRIPETGDRIKLNDASYEVVDMNGNRINKVLVRKIVESGNGEDKSKEEMGLDRDQ